MREEIRGSVDGRQVSVHGGMRVKHALIAFDTALYEACREGRMTVRDGNGFVVGLDGALEEGFELHTADTKASGRWI
jgi:hypothetical protein